MKMWVCLAVVLGFLAPTVGRAHIGDDMAQLRQAYGATAKKVGSAMIFQRNGYSICVYFDGDHSAMEVFSRDGSEKKKPDSTPEDMTQQNIDDILALEGDGQKWSPVTSHSGKPTWLRADNKLIARVSDATDADTGQGGKILVVMVNEK